MSKFPLPGAISQVAKRFLSTATGAAKNSTGGSGLENVVLHPSLQRRIEQLAKATANTKSHQAPFRNMLFYGPPGTGKTLVAREIARKSVSFGSICRNISALKGCFCCYIYLNRCYCYPVFPNVLFPAGFGTLIF